MEDASALNAAHRFERCLNTVRKAVRPYGTDDERLTITAFLRSTWESLRSTLRGAEKPDSSWVYLVLKYFSAAYLSRSGPQTAALRRGSTSGLPPIGYLKGIDSGRGIAWRGNDLLTLRQFLRIGLEVYRVSQ
jgi:hypothetical protein